MNLTWVDFYSELATKLLAYKNDRIELIKKIQKVFDAVQMKFPKMESNDILIDIDPFSIIGTFNNNFTPRNRITIAEAMGQEFGVEADVPQGFEGIPIVNNLSACFFYFKEECGAQDIQNLWNVFEAAIDFAETDSDDARKTFINFFNLVKDQKGIKWNITMGLYWIRPYTFVNLDETNREFMSNANNMPADFIAKLPSFTKEVTGEEYLMICNDCRAALNNNNFPYHTFPEMSHCAWMQKDSQKEHCNTPNTNRKSNNFSRWIKPLIQALRDLGGSAPLSKAFGTIIENENLTSEELNKRTGKNNKNKFETDVQWARLYLVNAGYIANNKKERGIWTLTEAGKTVELTDEQINNICKQNRQSKLTNQVNNNDSMPDQDIAETRYWLYAPGHGASHWEEFWSRGIMAIGWSEIGDLSLFESKNEIKEKMREVYDSSRSYIHDAHATWQFANEMQEGDIIFVKKGMYQIVGRGIVTSGYRYDPEQDKEFCNIREVKWLDKGIWDHPGKAVTKTLTDISPYTDYIEQLNGLFADEENEYDNDANIHAVQYPSYSADDFLKEVYLPEETYHHIVETIKIKKNVILQGAPGVGKTFIVKRLAYSMMGTKDKERVMMVQFHQSYSYEDFIMGGRTSSEGFKLKKGVFYNFCKKAEIDSDNDYFFIIDEINRGNLSKIFGELFMLIENDKRGYEVQLLYSEKFSIPRNIYIIGMMNTADRSLALLDYALRRRFAFVDLKPGFNTTGFKDYCCAINNEKFNQLIECVKDLNKSIASDEVLGEHFVIGHSYFCNLQKEDSEDIDELRLKSIVEFELIPLLKEYWFDDSEKVCVWCDKLREAIK